MINVPTEMKGRTGYLIMVDRFCREGEPPKPMEGRKLKDWSDANPDWRPDADGEYRNRFFYGGNLNGIASKVDYFKKLGVSAVFLSPISMSGSYHHYDVHDQKVIDPYIGTWFDFYHLAEEFHNAGILLGVDLVFNHRSADSVFFQKALAGDPEYRQWFQWDENGEPVYWCGFKDMPQCNKLNEAYQKFCCEEAKKYVNFGADLIRLDLGETFPREFLNCIRNAVKTTQIKAHNINSNPTIVSEMWDFAFRRDNPQIYDLQVDSVMNYPLTDAILRWVRYGNHLHMNACLQNLAKYPYDVHDVLLNYLDTHDTPRARNMLAGEAMIEDPFSGFIWDIEAGWRTPQGFSTYNFREWEFEHDGLLSHDVDKMHKLASLIQYLMKGVPVIYYGTEAGAFGYKDPFSRKPYPWGKENQEMLSYYCGLGKMRAENKDILDDGDMNVTVTHETIEIVRRNQNGIITAVINRTDKAQSVNVFYPGAQEIFSLERSNPGTVMPFGAYVCRF